MTSQSVSVLHEENGVRFVELSSTYDGTFCAPPAVEHLDAAFSSKDVTLYRFNSEVGSARLTLSVEEMTTLVEAWHAYQHASRPALPSRLSSFDHEAWHSYQCSLHPMSPPVKHEARSSSGSFNDDDWCPCSVCTSGDAFPLSSVPSSSPTAPAPRPASASPIAAVFTESLFRAWLVTCAGLTVGYVVTGRIDPLTCYLCSLGVGFWSVDGAMYWHGVSRDDPPVRYSLPAWAQRLARVLAEMDTRAPLTGADVLSVLSWLDAEGGRS